MMDVYEILDGQWFQSGQITDWDAVQRRGIGTVVALSQPDDLGHLRRADAYTIWEIEDGPLPDLRHLHALAMYAMECVRSGRPVLSHCAAGINRSSLFTGVVLWLLGTAKGPAIVDYIRAHRPGALQNQTFADYLAGLR